MKLPKISLLLKKKKNLMDNILISVQSHIPKVFVSKRHVKDFLETALNIL